jgi:cysteine sulfinate desulfinase/cysteine desulfurase-like protein
VLGALGVDDDLARATLRLSLGRWTTAGDVDHAAAQIREAVELIRGVERHRAAPAEAAGFRMIASGIR